MAKINKRLKKKKDKLKNNNEKINCKDIFSSTYDKKLDNKILEVDIETRYLKEIDNLIVDKSELLSTIRKLKNENELLLTKLIIEQEKNYNLSRENIDILKEYSYELEAYKKYLKDSLESEKLSLNTCMQNIYKINDLEKEINIVKSKYNSLKNSKLGKLTIKYWKIKKNFKVR